MAEKTTFKDSALRAVAVLGLIAVLLLGAWGIIQIAFNLPAFFGGIGSLFTKSETPAVQERLVVTTPAILTSGQAFTVSWAHAGASGNYGYALSYSCTSGLTFKAPVPAGTTQDVPCNTPFNYTNAAQSLTLTPTLASKTQMPVIFTVAANNLASGAITATGSSTATVLPAVSATTTIKPKTTVPSSTYVAATRRTAPYGLPDLRVSINSAVPVVNGRYSVQFVIQNDGTNVASVGWTFNALLPLSPVYTFSSQPQQALYPGDKIVYTLGFDAPMPYGGYNQRYQYNYSGTCVGYAPGCIGSGTNVNYNYNYTNGTITITVDPQNYLQESNKGNNTASAPLRGY